MPTFSRREAIVAMAAPALAQTGSPAIDLKLIQRNDDYVDSLVKRQIAVSGDPHRGGIPDPFGLIAAGTVAGFLDASIASWVSPRSRLHKSPALLDRIKLGVGWLTTHQLPSGNFDLPITNFDSPPDTGFITHSLGGAAYVAKNYQAPEIYALLDPILRKAGRALTVGGVHTPNHRWVVCEALAQLYELHGDEAYVKRIDQWLAETIDINPDGQYNERSTTVYNAVTNKALVVTAHKLKRWDLLDPVRKNLEAMLYLMHADGEVVTEISVRQDANERGTMNRYWFPLRYIALRDKDGRYATLTQRYEETNGSLTMYLQYPHLLAALPESAPIPSDYERVFPYVKAARVRRGKRSASILFNGNSRVFTFRNGDCVVNAVRFASAFFGKGQFLPEEMKRIKDGFVLTQSMEGPYYQPFEPSRVVAADDWGSTRRGRRQTEVCKMTYTATIRETSNGFVLDLLAEGTKDVPLAVEINLRSGGRLTGCEPLAGSPNTWLLKSGMAEFRSGSDTIRFGPGLGAHTYTRVRGALPQLPEESVYLCGFTPFRHSLRFEAV